MYLVYLTSVLDKSSVEYWLRINGYADDYYIVTTVDDMWDELMVETCDLLIFDYNGDIQLINELRKMNDYASSIQVFADNSNIGQMYLPITEDIYIIPKAINLMVYLWRHPAFSLSNVLNAEEQGRVIFNVNDFATVDTEKEVLEFKTIIEDLGDSDVASIQLTQKPITDEDEDEEEEYVNSYGDIELFINEQEISNNCLNGICRMSTVHHKSLNDDESTAIDDKVIEDTEDSPVTVDDIEIVEEIEETITLNDDGDIVSREKVMVNNDESLLNKEVDGTINVLEETIDNAINYLKENSAKDSSTTDEESLTTDEELSEIDKESSTTDEELSAIDKEPLTTDKEPSTTDNKSSITDEESLTIDEESPKSEPNLIEVDEGSGTTIVQSDESNDVVIINQEAEEEIIYERYDASKADDYDEVIEYEKTITENTEVESTDDTTMRDSMKQSEDSTGMVGHSTIESYNKATGVSIEDEKYTIEQKKYTAEEIEEFQSKQLELLKKLKDTKENSTETTVTSSKERKVLKGQQTFIKETPKTTKKVAIKITEATATSKGPRGSLAGLRKKTIQIQRTAYDFFKNKYGYDTDFLKKLDEVNDYVISQQQRSSKIFLEEELYNRGYIDDDIYLDFQKNYLHRNVLTLEDIMRADVIIDTFDEMTCRRLRLLELVSKTQMRKIVVSTINSGNVTTILRSKFEKYELYVTLDKYIDMRLGVNVD